MTILAYNRIGFNLGYVDLPGSLHYTAEQLQDQRIKGIER